MEFILQDTDIFDENLDGKLKDIILNNEGKFKKGTTYKFTISFHVDLLNDSRFQDFKVPIQSKTSKDNLEDKINDVLSYQLHKCNNILEECEIESFSKTIQGDRLKAVNSIRIEITEDTSEPTFMGRGKNKARVSVSSIVPDRLYKKESVAKSIVEYLYKVYSGFRDIITSNKIMSEILEIDYTEDDKEIFTAFAEQYWDLWLASKEKKKELLDRFMDKVTTVYNKDKEDQIE